MATVTKVDYTSALRHLYRAREEPNLVEVPPMRFLMIDGQGEPDGSDTFTEAVEALFAVAYAVKFQVRAEAGVDFGVLPLEALWWLPHAHLWDFAAGSDRQWTLMVMQPEIATDEVVGGMLDRIATTGSPPGVDRIRFAPYEEGSAVQCLHQGSSRAQRASLERLRAFIVELGMVPTGKHHEIYLSDPHRTAAHRLRTILRQPVRERD
jgi:hypothetical protein